jgi:hypothetical protein
MGRSELLPCAECGRHVREGAATCPFCGAAFAAGHVSRAEPSARTAAVAVVSAALALSGCQEASSSGGYGAACASGGCYGPEPDATIVGADASVDEAGTQDAAGGDAGMADAPAAADGSPADAPSTDGD